jgi:aryl-phospho-beta-D-glucosidase BglC (GH1 family)
MGIGDFIKILGDAAQQLKGISLTGFETGTRETNSGGGYWLYDPGNSNVQTTLQIVQNVINTMAKSWGVKILRVPVCGSAWLQNYVVKDWSNNQIAKYSDWVDNAVKTGTNQGLTMIIDLHLWAIAKETVTTRNAGSEDGCTGINKVCVGVPQCVDSCAPHDWYGQYTSQRTGKTYNQGDGPQWECAIANADGCTLDNIKRNNNTEHFLNFWYDVANHYKSNTNVWFELFNEPYQRKSAQFNDPACKEPSPGTAFMCPPGTGFGDNLPEEQYDWAFWSDLMNQGIQVIRGTGATNVIIVTGLDWNYDYLGVGTTTGGPIVNPSLIKWQGVQNVAYALHPYQHGSCCGQIGSTSDLSISDQYQSAFCQYAPDNWKASNSPLPIPSSVTAGSKQCDSTGYATTQDKKISSLCLGASRQSLRRKQTKMPREIPICVQFHRLVYKHSRWLVYIRPSYGQIWSPHCN